MSQGGSFLSQDDQKLFVTPGRLVARSVRRVAEGGDQKPELVTRAVLGQLNQLPEFEQNRFRCCCISVVPDDGMSWSAELIAGAIAEAAPQYKRWCIRDAPERSKLPAIAEIIGERRFVNCAAKWKFTTRFLSLRPWMTWAILAFSIVFSAVLEAVKLLKPSIPAGSRAAQSDVWIWLYGLAVALMGFAVQATAKKREIRPKSKSIRELRQRLNEEKESEEFDKFAAELAELLRRDDFPRVIILDDYDALDETSRQVLKAYLNSNPDQNNAELWVIFQSREGERLGSWILDEQAQVVRRSQVALYEQLPLSTREKIELLRVLGRDQAAAQYTPIKLVCGSVTETKKPLIEYFQNWRNSHPAQPEKYGDLDFLYFLSITSAPGDLYLRPSFLSSWLAAQKTGVAAEALKQFFAGKGLEADEFEDRCQKLIKNFRRVLTSGEDGSSIRVAPEAAQILDEMSEALQLPPRELGHLFWSVLWHGIWTLRPVEAFWTRKIALHLLHARAGALDRPEHRPGARILLLGMILSCVDRVLQTCLFALEIPLFTKTVRILKDSAATPALLEPVLEKAFECYAVLGDSRPEADFTDPEIKADSRDLAVVLGELVTLRTAQTQLVTKPGRLLPALQLFLDSLPASELHEGLKEECLRWLETAGAVNARDYATCRAAWLVMTLWPMNTPAAILYLRPVLECTTQALDELLLELPRRLLQPQSASRRASDLASLSMAFWCQALAISFLTQGSEADENHRNDKLIGLARCGAETLAAIEELRRSRSQLIPQNDLLSRAMAREVGAVTLSAMLTACHYLRASHNHSFSQEVVEEIGAVFLRMEQTLAFPLPKITNVKHLLSREVINAVNDLLKLCVLVWARFGLTQLHDLLALRQVHFSAIALELQFDDAANVRHLIESLSSALERPDFVGLISNCILADCFQAAEDLSAQAVCRAADLALRSNLGAELKGSLAVIAIEKAHAFGIDLSSFLEVLIATNESGESFLAGYLRNCPAHQVCDVALRFLNAASNSKAQDFNTPVEQISWEAAKQMPEGAVREEIESLLDARLLHRAFQQPSHIDTHQILAKWVNRKHLWVYPMVLRDLLKHGQSVEEVRREALAVLDGQGRQGAYNSYYLLAIDLAQTWFDLSADPAAAGKVVQYIKQDLPRWERICPAELNMRVYMTLERLEAGEREAYKSKIMKWQALHWEAEHLKRLPNLVKQGQLYLVFEQYFQWMQFWGLGTDMNHAEFSEFWNQAPHTRETMVAEWHMRGEIVPGPLVKQGNRWVVSSEFLLLGSSLFRPPLESSEQYHTARTNFNDAAGRSFRDLIRLVIDLPNVPPNVAELLRVHAERLSTFSNPTETGSKPLSVVA